MEAVPTVARHGERTHVILQGEAKRVGRGLRHPEPVELSHNGRDELLPRPRRLTKTRQECGPRPRRRERKAHLLFPT